VTQYPKGCCRCRPALEILFNVAPDIPEAAKAQVRFGATWYEALVLSWALEGESWWAYVRWWPPSGISVLGTFPERDIRRA
jgi:hypothetical protein